MVVDLGNKLLPVIFVCIMATSVYASCSVPVAPLRKSASHIAEQISQLLFGEKVLIMEKRKDHWVRVRCEWDGYEGWCLQTQLAKITKKEYVQISRYMVTHQGGKIIFSNHQMFLPPGSNLQRKKVKLIEEGTYKGTLQRVEEIKITPNYIQSVAYSFLYAPYQWGGRSPAGIDCSGLTQLVYKLGNIPLPRDAWQQAEKGVPVDFLQDARCGDLAFFDNEEGRINHTGLLINNNTIIHATEASGCVVADKIDLGGIINLQHRKRTHKLRFIRRILDY